MVSRRLEECCNWVAAVECNPYKGMDKLEQRSAGKAASQKIDATSMHLSY